MLTLVFIYRIKELHHNILHKFQLKEYTDIGTNILFQSPGQILLSAKKKNVVFNGNNILGPFFLLLSIKKIKLKKKQNFNIWEAKISFFGREEIFLIL